MAEKSPKHLTVRTFEDVLREVTHERHALEVQFVAQRRVACMGDGGALGHPKVFYTVGDKGYAECMYCDKVFVLDPARDGEVFDPRSSSSPQKGDDRTESGERNRQQTTKELPGDGLTESATPPPGEVLESGHDTVSSPRRG